MNGAHSETWIPGGGRLNAAAAGSVSCADHRVGAGARGLSRMALLALSLVGMMFGPFLAGCSTQPDKRLLQYLNTQGFGSRYTGNAEQENYVSIGDQIVYADEYNPELAGALVVDIDGTVVLPEVGTVPVAGMTRTELEAFLTQKFSGYYTRTDVRVSRIGTGSKVFYIYGETALTGPRPFPGNLTVFEAVMLSNPDRVRANLGRVKVIRADPRDPLIIVFDVRDMTRYGDSTYNILIQERDIIIIPPTLLAQIGNFLAALITPFTTVFQQVIVGLFQLNNLDRQFGNQGNAFNIF